MDCAKIHECAKDNIRLGLCCICNCIREDSRDWLIQNDLISERPRAKVPLFCSRSTVRKGFTVEKAKQMATQNCKDLEMMLKWCTQNGIYHYRMSSEMFPHFNDPETPRYTMDFAQELLTTAGDYAASRSMRLTMHPGQFVLVSARDPIIFENSQRDLEMHAEILDRMKLGPDSVLCIHGGGTYGDKENTMRRWIEQFDDLPKNVKSRVAIENCEKNYNVRDCLEISEATGVPVIYDSHHYKCYDMYHPNETQEPIEDMLPEIIESWSGRKMLCHVSDQAQGKAVGAHHDYVQEIPKHLLSIPMEHGVGLDIEVEAKAKEAAIFKLYSKYNDIF
jgi:UV DNA damage endonuclease